MDNAHNNTWNTKEDALKDLAKCTGLLESDFDDEYIVRGDKPPPPRRLNDDDEEYNIRFGKYGNEAYDDDVAPDFNGITQMLRMVNTFNAMEEKSPEVETSKESPIQNIVISKLNPNVSDFVPKTKQTEIVANSNNSTETKNNVKPCESVSEDSNDDEKKKMVAALKNKISSISKDDTLDRKREKNVAMAALMKLNTASSTAPVLCKPLAPKLETKCKDETQEVEPSLTSSPKPLVLFTPDYFAGIVSSATAVTGDDDYSKPVKPLKEPVIKTPSSRELSDPHMKESIDKVNSWLDGPEKKVKPKPAGAHLGPVTFKKKEALKSPCPSDRTPVTNSPITCHTSSYVPSDHAIELAKQYEQRVREKEEKEKNAALAQDRTFSGLLQVKLDNALKAKEEKKLRSKASEREISSTSPSSLSN